METDTNNTVIFDEVEAPKQERSWLNRTFGKMEKDSLRSTIFLMMAGTLGAGVYALHNVFYKIGIFWAIVLILYGCLSSLVALDMYIHASRVAGDPDSVSEINTHIAGKTFDLCSSIVTTISLYLAMLSFTICISSIIINIICSARKEKVVLNEKGQIPNEIFFFYHRFNCLAIAVVGVLFILPKNTDILSRCSIVCFLIHVYMILVIIGQTYSNYLTVKQKNLHDLKFSNGNIWDFFDNFGLAVCAFNNVPNFMMARTLVKSPSKSRLRKIFNRANWVILAVYIITAACGYMSVGNDDNMPGMIFLRKSNSETDYLMTIGKCLLGLSLIVSYSLCGFALKSIVLSYIPGTPGVSNIIVSLSLVASLSLISMFLRDVGNFLSLAGSFGGTFIVVIFPAILALKSGYSKVRTINIGIYAWLVVSSILGAISTVLAFKKIINPSK